QLTIVFLGIYFVLFLLMQRLLPLFGFFAVVAAGGGALGPARDGGLRGMTHPSRLVLAAVVAIFLFQDFGWEGKRDYWRSAARGLKVPSREQFVIFPYAGDVDGDLLDWIRRNVEPNAVIMAPHYLSPQILTYADRATNLNDFFESPKLRRKAERLLTLLYSDESRLYRFCSEQSSDYLLVSCAVGCDATKESPLYQAGLINMPPGSAAYRLMFEPEKLALFDLVYENEMYRLFRVGRGPSVRTWFRSPLFYERELLWNMSGDMNRFYETVMRIYARTARGSAYITRGAERKGEDDLVAALRMFYFYPAWKKLDGLYERLGRTEDRETIAALAYRYDPNRGDVCLALAASSIALGNTDGVREILDRCSSLPMSARDRETAAALRARLESVTGASGVR
ncbi:MAG: tetratricopeptide repeat protein, partial [Candidatus Krumholzibacteria bacterium]|nr:tetratricopeptide repeat protein [Candidatus Krumholzibacteria bacterium]